MERQIMKRSSCDSGKGGIRHFEVICLKLLAPIEIDGLHILRYREAMHRHVLACFVLPPIDHTRILRRVGFHGLKIDECVIHKIYVMSELGFSRRVKRRCGTRSSWYHLPSTFSIVKPSKALPSKRC